MSRVAYLSETRRDEIVADAARKQTPVVLTWRGPSAWRVAKAHFEGLSEHDRRLFIARPPDLDAPAIALPATGELLGVAFRRGHKKCLFNTTVVQAPTDARTGTEGTALTVCWPSDVQELQRRVYQRACPPRDRPIKARIWAAGAQAKEGQGLTGTVEDLSAGGVRVRVADDPHLEPGQGVRIDLAVGSRRSEMAVDGTFRHCQATENGHWSLGLQFVGLETSREGQELLVRIARMVTDFQRSTLRRRPPRLRPHRQA